MRKHIQAFTGPGPRLFYACLLLMLAAGWPAAARGEDEADEPVAWSRPVEYPSGPELLADVRAGLPREELQLKAELRSKRRSGAIEEKLLAEVNLDWRGDTKESEYIIRDFFGAELERLSIRLHAGRDPVFIFTVGPAAEGPAPVRLDQPIRNTDVTWQDLTLSFLWWPGGETVDAEKVKGRLCYVVDLPAPAAAPGDRTRVRLWVDARVRMLLRADQYDERGARVRRLEVKSLKKIRQVWMVKDLEVTRFPSRHRTAIRVTSLKLAGAELEEGPEEDMEGDPDEDRLQPAPVPDSAPKAG
jgi:hypothetical protein